MATLSVPPPNPNPNPNPNPTSSFSPPPPSPPLEDPQTLIEFQEPSPSPPSPDPHPPDDDEIASREVGEEEEEDSSVDSPPRENPNPNPSPTPTLQPIRVAPPPQQQQQHPSSSSSAPAAAAEGAAAAAAAPSLLHLSFNQDYGCFAAGTEGGFRIYNCDPFREIFRRDFDGGGIGAVEMLFRCNILALVGGGPQPYYSPNKVMIWDDHQSRCIGELSFRSEVRAVRLRRDRIIVVLDHKIFVYNFADLKLFHQIETVPNPKGLCVVSQQQGSLVLVCPGGQKGQVRVEHYGARRTKFIMAHDSRIACLALSQDGRLIATASTKGTLVRIFSTSDGTLLQEWLAVSSDKGTVHVFNLKVNLGLTANDRPRPAPDPNVPQVGSSLSFIRGVLPKYFHSEWSVAQFRLHEGTQYIVAFGHQKNTVVIVGMDGSFYRCQFDPANGGEMTQLECYSFLKPDAVA